MAEKLYISGDIGATQMRIAVFDEDGFAHSVIYDETISGDYEASINKFADLSQSLANGRGQITAVSTAVAAEVAKNGELTKAGDLKSWRGKIMYRDIADAMGLPPERVGAMNDVVAIAYSQEVINTENGNTAPGYAFTLSSGFGGARFNEIQSDEPGHELHREGAVCPCGEAGHAEAFISGKGILKNHGISMKDWLANPVNSGILVADLTTVLHDLIERHYDHDGFVPKEIRWTGGVAINQPFIMQQVGKLLRAEDNVRVFDTVTMGDHAGLHGTFMDALKLAAAY